MTDLRHIDLLTDIVSSRPRKTTKGSTSICADCGSDAAAIADCRAHDHDHDRWVIQLRCGDCGRWQELDVSHDAMVRLEQRVMADWHSIERNLGTLERERMRTDVEALVAALERDLIDAGDFARAS